MYPPVYRFAVFASFVLFPLVARGAPTLYELHLDSDAGICNPDSPVSCVRYDGNSTDYVDGTVLDVEADFDNQIGDEVPLVLPDLFLPDVPLGLGDIVEIEAPGEGGNGGLVTGAWNLTTGELIIDLSPVLFPNLVLGGASVDPFELTTGGLPGELFCEQTIPPMVGSPILGSPTNPGAVTVVGRACVQAPGVNEAFFVVLSGTLEFLPEPGAGALTCAAAAALAALAGANKRASGPVGRAHGGRDDP